MKLLRLKYLFSAIAIIFIVLFVARVIYVNSKFDKIQVVEHSMNSSFLYKDMTISITDACWLNKDEFDTLYGSNPIMSEYYDSLIVQSGLQLLQVTVNVSNLTTEGYNHILKWDISYNTTGNSSTIFTDLVNDMSDINKENHTVYLFFRCNPNQYGDVENIKYYIRAGLYPKQDIILLELNGR